MKVPQAVLMTMMSYTFTSLYMYTISHTEAQYSAVKLYTKDKAVITFHCSL